MPAHTETTTENMRTKTLFVAAAALAAGVLASVAQSNVYSLNVVGYVNVTVPANGFVLVGNPLDTGSNVLDNILGTAPNNTTKVFGFDSGNGAYTAYTKRSAGWSGAAGVNFNPGSGFFIQNSAATDITLTFVGQVMQGTNMNAYPSGFSILASQVPQAGLVQTDLGLPAQNNDQVYQFNPVTGAYTAFTRRATAWGGGAEPMIGTNAQAGVAEAFFFNSKNGAGTWTRVFNVQ